MHKRFYLISAVIVSLFACPSFAAETAEEAGDQGDGTKFSIADFTFRVGFYDISSSTKIRVDALGGLIGTTIDLENDLNLDETKSTSYLSVGWRMSGRHHLELEQFKLSRSGLETLSAQIEFGDQVFDIGATVNSFFETKITRLSYSYVVRDTEKSMVALSAGLHRTSLAVGISDIMANFNADPVAIAEATAPLPVIGVDAGWKFNERWSITGRAQIFRLKIAEYSGRLNHATVRIEYDPFKYVGFGVGYDMFSMGLDIERDLWNGSVTYSFQGPLAYVKGHF